MNKIIFCSMFGLFCFVAKAQQIIYPGSFRFASDNGPVMNYWKDSAIIQQFTNELDNLLQQKMNLRLPQHASLRFVPFKKSGTETPAADYKNKFPKINIDLIEFSTAGYIQQFNLDILDTAFVREVQSVFSLQVNFQANAEQTSFAKSIDIFIKNGPGNGMGVPVHNVPVTAKGFTQLMQKSIEILLDTSAQHEQIEMKVSRPYIGDNFVLAKTAGMPRTEVQSSKRVSRFLLFNRQQILRWGEQEYRDIVLKGKNKTLLSSAMQDAISKHRTSGASDFVFLLQEGRDVIGDKNYQLQMPAQLSSASSEFQAAPFIHLLPGVFHSLLSGNDTVALFSIRRDVPDPEKKLFFHQVSNGIDPASLYTITETPSVVPLKYDFLVEGNIKGAPFRIEISSGAYIREFFLNNRLISIALGNKAPERFVIFDPSVSAELFNALLIIGFNTYFQ
ncbi:MAG: hypothetical protein WAP48_01645 [Sediminibacterium sp.]